MHKTLVDLLKLFILINLLVLALFTIPVESTQHQSADSSKPAAQHKLTSVATTINPHTGQTGLD